MHTICKFAMNIIKLIFFRVIYICITVYISLTDQFVVGQQEEMPVCTTHMYMKSLLYWNQRPETEYLSGIIILMSFSLSCDIYFVGYAF